MSIMSFVSISSMNYWYHGGLFVPIVSILLEFSRDDHDRDHSLLRFLFGVLLTNRLVFIF